MRDGKSTHCETMRSATHINIHIGRQQTENRGVETKTSEIEIINFKVKFYNYIFIV